MKNAIFMFPHFSGSAEAPGYLRWHSKAPFDYLLYRQHFCQSKSTDICQSYSKPKVERFLRHSAQGITIAAVL